MPTPNTISQDVQRCRELAAKIENPECFTNYTRAFIRIDAAVSLLPHLAAVLAELERLQGVEEERKDPPCTCGGPDNWGLHHAEGCPRRVTFEEYVGWEKPNTGDASSVVASMVGAALRKK